MQKHLLYINLFAITSALAFTACSDEVDNIITPDVPETGEKTPIELSVGLKGEERTQTRGITITPANTSEYRAFANSTNLYMVYKCEDLSTANRSTKYSKTIGLAAQVSNPGDGTWSAIDFARENYANDKGKFVRYWDDAYARESALSIYAICLNGCDAYGANGSIVDSRAINFGGDATYANLGWATSVKSTLVSWNLSNYNDKFEQSQLPLVDMCYSNNISKYTSSNGVEVDARLKFGSVTPKTFDSGKMVFYHMTSKLTFIFKKGDGFTDSEFNFNANTNVTLNEFNRRVENFDVATGELNSGNGKYISGTIDKLWEDTDAKTDVNKHVVRGLVFPGTNISQDNSSETLKGKDVVFYINNNKYEVSRTALYKAIKDKAANVDSDGKVLEKYLASGTTLKPGVHYVFTFVVGKAKIQNISASIVDWETVVAEEQTPTNARITLNVEERTDKITKSLGNGDAFSLFLAKNDNTGDIDDNYTAYGWQSGYNTKVNLNSTENYVSGDKSHWKTDLFWDSNLNFYHFRTLCEAHGTENTTAIPDNDENKLSSKDSHQYYTLKHGETVVTAETTTTYKDICWGAPMLDVVDGNETDDHTTLRWNYDPETYGFDGLKADVEETPKAKHQIYKAIGPTEDAVKIVLFHMMSDVTIKVKTTNGSDAVVLKDTENNKVTNIELQNIYTEGNLYMGNGRVQGVLSGSATEKGDFKFTATPAPDASGVITWANYGAIPQDLENVVLVITTADNNQYKVKMEDVLATSVTDNNIVNPYKKPEGSSKYQIDAWYPGYKYEYSFTLKKKGIVEIEATIVDWEKVEAGEDEVWIE